MKNALLFLLLKLFLLLPSALQAQQLPRKSVEEFVTQFYIHGIPADEVKSYTEADVPTLAAMLENPAYQKSWMNIVIVLGYIGSPQATKPLTQFIGRQKGEISVETFRAVLYVFQSLGHIARKGGDTEALRTLEDYLSPTSWKTKKLTFSFARYQQAALSEVLGRQAIQGLGLSGKPAAYRALADLKNSKSLQKDWVDNVDEALSQNKAIQTRGVESVLNRK